MKIALFSDVHANLPALEATLAHIDSMNADAVYCLGDLVGYNTWPNEVIALIRKRKIPTIAGNYDYGIGRGSNDCGCAYKTENEKNAGAISIAYTNASIGDDERKYLRELPMHIRIEFIAGESKINLLLVHGSPRKINEYLFEDRDEKSLLRIIENAGADILCFGHTHQPYHRVLSSTKEGVHSYRHAINTGSVGKPKDGDSRSCYVLLTLHDEVNLSVQDSFSVEFVRVPYNVEVAARAIEESILPGEYALMLRDAN